MRVTEPAPFVRDELLAELAGLAITSGGRGCLLVISGWKAWITPAAGEALTWAAASLGFGERSWHSVVDAIVAGYWPDLVSEAIQLIHNELPPKVVIEIAIGA